MKFENFRNSQESNPNQQDKVPTILRHLKNAEIKQGNTVQLDLFAVGEPQPEV